jgi:hypothetical protein
MSDPIQEPKETNSSRRKGLEAWAAAMAARERPPGPPPAPEQDGSGPAYARPGASQRPLKVKTVTQVQKNHQSQKNSDGVELSRNKAEVQPELTLGKARELMKGDTAKVATNPQAAPPPPLSTSKTPAVKTEKVLQQAKTQQVAEEAQVVTAEELQQSPSVARTVVAQSAKSAGTAEKAEDSKTLADTEEPTEEQETPSLIKPGNDPKARAYVRAGDFLSEGTSNPELDDFMLAL